MVAIVVMGVAGSGKSTAAAACAARLGWPFAEGDDFHPPANVAKMAGGQPLGDEDRWGWLGSIAAWIGEREAAGASSVVACSALRRAYRDVLRGGRPGAVRFVHLAAPEPALRERLDRRRGHFMPATLLASQLATLEPLEQDEQGAVIEVAGLTPGQVRDAVVAQIGRWLAESPVPPVGLEPTLGPF